MSEFGKLKREHDSTDDFEHLEHELQHHQPPPLLDLSNPLPPPVMQHNIDRLTGDARIEDLLDTSVPAGAGSNGSVECDLKPVPVTPPPSADFEKFEGGARSHEQQHQHNQPPSYFAAGQQKDELEARIREQLSDAKAATMAFVESEKSPYGIAREFEVRADDADIFGRKDDHQDIEDDILEARRDNDSPDDDTEFERSEPSEPKLIAAPPAVPAHANNDAKRDSNLLDDDDMMFAREEFGSLKEREPPSNLYDFDKEELTGEIKASTLPEPEKSPELDFVKDEIIVHEATKEKPLEQEYDSWNLLGKTEEKELHDEPPSKPLPPLPKGAEHDLLDDFDTKGQDKYTSHDFLMAESKLKDQSGGETGDSEFESEPEPSPAKTAPLKPTPAPAKPELGDAAERKFYCQKPADKNRDIEEIAPKEIFRHIGIDAWFNPERLNPKVAALIYWRDPKKSGIVFGATLAVLLSLAYFSLISVVAYISLLTLTFTVAFRIYKTVLQAIQKTSDGHPFKDILEVDLTLPAEKVHEVADIAVANANAAVGELRRLFLVEDFVDSLKFGILLWSLTYLGSWFNGMTLIIIGVVALFTLPKVYETNKTQIDQNLALVQAKINEITAKVKAAMPLGKKAEPTKEE